MKLRNKKTGVVADVQGLAIHNISFDLYDKNNKKLITDVSTMPTYYSSLAELNEEWEDYISKEPMVRAKEIREEIKLFAYRNEINCFRYQAINGALYNEADNGAVISLEVSDKREVEHLVDRCLYTLEQLCGEEECA